MTSKQPPHPPHAQPGQRTTIARAALIRLAAALDPRDFHTTLIPAGPDRLPRLNVTSRHAQLGEDIHAGNGWYWWSWGEPIGPIDDPHAAAAKIAAVLRVVPEAARG